MVCSVSATKLMFCIRYFNDSSNIDRFFLKFYQIDIRTFLKLIFGPVFLLIQNPLVKKRIYDESFGLLTLY